MLKPKKYIASFILLTFFFSSISCNIKNSISDFDDRIIIAGTILNSENYPDDYTIKIIINDFTKSAQRTHVSYLVTTQKLIGFL